MRKEDQERRGAVSETLSARRLHELLVSDPESVADRGNNEALLLRHSQGGHPVLQPLHLGDVATMESRGQALRDVVDAIGPAMAIADAGEEAEVVEVVGDQPVLVGCTPPDAGLNAAIQAWLRHVDREDVDARVPQWAAVGVLQRDGRVAHARPMQEAARCRWNQVTVDGSTDGHEELLAGIALDDADLSPAVVPPHAAEAPLQRCGRRPHGGARPPSRFTRRHVAR
mmetsp:Transcript_76550/g.247749  ORF Transcript_76550/g.247749 Transcript_76550/m.247749 type:complete len:227 (+) Transcript_76550:702-1382(+)